MSGLLVYGLKWITPAEAGLKWLQPASLRAVGPVVAAVACALFVEAYLSRHVFADLWRNEQLYYATLPGLEEELFYRGVLLGLLGRVFPRRTPLLGARTSWGGVVVALLFALGHVIKFPALLLAALQAGNSFGSLRHAYYWLPLMSFGPSDALYYLGMSALLLWVRERTGSCWAAVSAHCIMNGCLAIGHAINY